MFRKGGILPKRIRKGKAGAGGLREVCLAMVFCYSFFFFVIIYFRMWRAEVALKRSLGAPVAKSLGFCVLKLDMTSHVPVT